ncbi:hypothetical protein O9929_13445 [Vibrio lentus]|nr:hypothetical protein [Vibrio lentus]
MESCLVVMIAAANPGTADSPPSNRYLLLAACQHAHRLRNSFFYSTS